MFYLTYMFNELRRRKGRTLLTSLGLAVGVGLVVVVNALSTGLDRAQAEVLQPLTGVGTDMSVTRPIAFDESAEGGPFGGLSEEERAQLREENGGGRLGLRNLGEPGTTFSRDQLVSSAQLSFPATEVAQMEQIAGVAAATGALTLDAITVSGTVPEEPEPQGRPGLPGQGGGGLESLDVSSFTVTGIDPASAELGIVTAGQVTGGRFLRAGTAREAVLNASYASRSELGVGDTFSVGGKTFTVVGLVATPLGGQASDVYVQLSQLQSLSGREGRVNTALVRATSGDVVDEVAAALTAGLEGAEVTTASDLAERVSGSLVDARSLAGKLGTALAIVGLLAAFLIAALLTLASVNKRVRELGTLKAIGWSQRLVVRQVTGEALLQGLLGGLLGIALGLLGVIAIDAVAPTLQATVAAADGGAPRFGPGAFGQGAVVEAASTEVELDAAVSTGLVLVAVALAVAGGLFAGAVGGLRAARLRPAAALRHID